MKKYILSFILGGVLVFSSCGGSEGSESQEITYSGNSVSTENIGKKTEPSEQNKPSPLRYKVTKATNSNKYSGDTKIEVLTINELIAEYSKSAERQMKTESEKEILLRALRSESKGGEIRLTVERVTIDAANSKFFTVIIKDDTDKEIFRKQLDQDVPNTPNSNNMWWNLNMISIPFEIHEKFFVYVVDAIQDTNFKFEVTPIFEN